MSVTSPKGFRAAGVAAGLKASGGLDVAVVLSDGPRYDAAGVFTSNRIQAAPVVWSREVLRHGQVRAVVLNSGGANACTGPAGFQDTHATAEHAAKALGIGAADVAVCSTGLIGERLPMPALLTGVTSALEQAGGEAAATLGGASAAEAIMTTDTRPKTVAIADTAGFTVGGMAKGAGMLAPGLATMLVVLTTDAVADASTLDSVLRDACRVTFDRLDSDGCMSTNDTVLLLASGASGVAPDAEVLASAVRAVCDDLAAQLLGDAEGSTKDIAISVTNAATEDDAVEVGRAVARSNLVKTAFFGNDPNWGRILSAIGTTTAVFEPDAVDVSINGVPICVGGAAGADRSGVDLSARAVGVTIDLHAGGASAVIRTNDLSLAYVHENSAYST